jgi:hypothetical protein
LLAHAKAEALVSRQAVSTEVSTEMAGSALDHRVEGQVNSR